MTYVIRAEGLVKRYGTTAAVDGVDLEVRAGEVVGLIGPNGAGKSTVVRILSAHDRPDAGRATVCGHDVVRERRRVRALLTPAGDAGGAGGTDDAGRAGAAGADRLLGCFALTGAVGRPVDALSDGERRGLELVARLSAGPQVLILDEPDSGLDVRARRAVRDVVRRLAAEGTAVLFTTQHPDEADGLADRVALLDRGRIVAEGRPEEVGRRAGEASLRVRPSLAGDGDAVSRILTELTGAAPSYEPHTGTLSAPAADPMLLSALVRRLERSGIGTETLGLHQPTLQDALAALAYRPTARRAE
ncbi:ATP-binding cassette domain-containing protein [Streptomyces sp. NPDC056463]|uniref:ATP-binding cassette domain-containing protein n=1 Tax=Streptomyces sp. NPDC056463 TaxID=3345827 RepID=UPI0036B2C67F